MRKPDVHATSSSSRAAATALDDADPLARFRKAFVVTDPDIIYLDGNSLGRLPRRAASAVERALKIEWGDGLVRSWHEWVDLPDRVGNKLAPLIGAAPGEVLVCDQTSINLFKLASAGLAKSGRSVIVADDSNFPSDRYVLDAVARAAGGSMREVSVDTIEGPTVNDLAAAMDEQVGLVSLSLVAFKSGALADAAAITRLAHDAGAMVLWDLSHAAGAVPVDLRAIGADLAVGCTYKYLNGGPGAPAFLFVAEALQNELTTPIPGWFGHDDMFALEGQYRPAPGVRRFAIGTPPILSMRAAEAGIELTAEAGMSAIRDKSIALTELFIRRSDEVLAEHGFEVVTPRDAARRGSHVSLAHDDAYGITQALIERGVVPDFRAPNSVRFGFAPLYNTFADVFDAIEHIAEVIRHGEHKRHGAPPRGGVT